MIPRMPRTSLFVLALTSLAGSCARGGHQAPSISNTSSASSTVAAAPARDHGDLAALVPGQPPGVYLGAPLAEVSAARPALREQDDMDFRIVMVEEHVGEVAEYTYYFSTEGDRPLYEVIATYADQDTAVARFERDFRARGVAEPGDALAKVVFAGLPWRVEAWQFDATVVVAAAIPGTEYADD